MRRFAAVLLLALFAALAANAADADGQKLAFVRWEKDAAGIWTADADGKNAAKLTAGYDPEISPDGTRVACTYSDKTGGRFIAICDIASKKRSVLRNIPGDNSYGPRWSPDGKKLAFNHFTEASKWTIGVIDVATKKCRIFSLPKKSDGVYSPFWPRDGQSVFANDFNTVYAFDAANGKNTAEMSIIDIIDRASILISSATRFDCSSDGKTWLIREENGNEKCAACDAAGGFGMKGAIFLYDVAAKKTTRVSPKELCVTSAAWRGGDIFFTAHRTDAKPVDRRIKTDIYKMSPEAGRPELILEDGDSVSVSD